MGKTPRSRSGKRALAGLFDSAGVPIFAVDERRKIVYCNPACCEWLDVDADELYRVRCNYHTPADALGVASLAAGLCPPPEAFAGRRVRAQLACRTESGRPVRRWAEFQPLGDDPLECIGVLAVVDGADSADGETAAGDEPSPHRLHERVRSFRRRAAEDYCVDRLVGDSPPMRRVREQVRLAAAGTANVLIVGPAGSGREHVARTIHYGTSEETAGPIVPLACELLDAELMQTSVTAFLRSELPGPTCRQGRLLLLEVDRLPRDAQTELVGFLNIPDVSVGVVATAREDLPGDVPEDRFRYDLACALSTMVIRLPALAERAQDIPLLAQLYLEEGNARGDRQLGGFTPEALDRLAGYAWPGNLDELAEMVRQTHRAAEGPLVTVVDLPQRIRLADHAAEHPMRTDETIRLDRFLAQIETETIDRAMRRARGNKTKAAKLLGVSRARLHRKLEAISRRSATKPPTDA